MAKIDVLRKNFELLKDSFNKTDKDGYQVMSSFKNIVIPMIESSFDEGCEMWVYLLKRYSDEELAFPIDYHHLTDDMVESLEFDDAVKVFSRKDDIAEYVFKFDKYDGHLHCEWFIRDLINNEYYDLARKLINLLIENTYGDNDPQQNLFDTLYQAIVSSETRWKINSNGIDFLTEWFNKVESKTRRAQLEVGLLSLIDCVEGDSPKGAMPFSMINDPGALERLAADKSKTKPNNMATSQPSEFDIVMKERREQQERKKAEKALISELKDTTIDESVLNEAMRELNDLIGLETVKEDVKSLCNFMRVRQLRKERQLKVPDMSQHLVFSGNPGTGKTTVARIIGRIYHALGFLSKGHFVEVDRSGLVAGYVGQTAIKTQEVIDSAMGGVMFIDEAYSLAPKYKEDFGAEAIETILKSMEDHREDFVVIVAGYDELMESFINSNPGLKSRFNKFIHFPDYKGNELLDIFLKFLERNNYTIEIQALPILSRYFEQLYVSRDENFGNARDVRNIFEKVVANQANRIVTVDNLSDKDILEIKKADFKDII